MTYSAQRIGRGILDLLRHVLTAALGTAIAGSQISRIYHAKTLTGTVTKEITISAIVAFLLGALSQHLRPSNLTRWVWLLGIATLAFTVTVEHASVLDGGGTAYTLISPLDLRDPKTITMWFLAVRFVAYSIGGIFYTSLATRISAVRIQTAPPEGGLEASGE